MRHVCCTSLSKPVTASLAEIRASRDPNGFNMHRASHPVLAETRANSESSKEFGRSSSRAIEPDSGCDSESDIDYQIAVWVNEGGAGGEVTR